MLTADAKRIKEMAKKNLWSAMSTPDLKILISICNPHLPREVVMIADKVSGVVEKKEFFNHFKFSRTQLIEMLKKALKRVK